MFVTWCDFVGWVFFFGGTVLDAVAGWSRSCIGCQIWRTSCRSCFTWCGMAPSCFVRDIKRWTSWPGCCGWCGDPTRPQMALCSRAAQRPYESLVASIRGAGVQILVVIGYVQDDASWCKLMQDDARWCKTMQDDARQCKMMQDDARWCKAMQDDARCCKTMQDDVLFPKWLISYTASWYRTVLNHLCGILHNKMKEHVLNTASWYWAFLNIKILIYLICTLNVCKMLGIDKRISSTFVAFLEVSVGAVHEISRIA